MADIEKVIKGLEEAEIMLIQAVDRGGEMAVMGAFKCLNRVTDALAMLKEQKAVKPVRDEETGRLWLCGNCGTYVGFEDNDPHDPNEFDKYCRECGRPVLWEGR